MADFGNGPDSDKRSFHLVYHIFDSIYYVIYYCFNQISTYTYINPCINKQELDSLNKWDQSITIDLYQAIILYQQNCEYDFHMKQVIVIFSSVMLRKLDIKGMLQEYWKIDMFLETFRLLACAISNFVWSPYKDFWTLDLGTW